MIIAEIYKMIVYIHESEHKEIVRLREKDFRPLYERNKIFDKIYVRERKLLRSVLPVKVTFREWLEMAYREYKYKMFKRYQVVKMFFQYPEDISRKSPRPFADVRAWHFYEFKGEEVDTEVSEEYTFEYLHDLREECHYLTDLFPSLVSAYKDGAVEGVRWGEEYEQIDEDEITDNVCETYRAGLFYRYIPEFIKYIELGDYKSIMEYKAEELWAEVGVYLEYEPKCSSVRCLEKAFKERCRAVFGYFDKEEIIKDVKEEKWDVLIKIWG